MHGIVQEFTSVHLSLQRVRVAAVAVDVVVAPLAFIRIPHGINVLPKWDVVIELPNQLNQKPKTENQKPQAHLAEPVPLVIHPRAGVSVAVSPRLRALPVPLATLQFARVDGAILVAAPERAVLQSLRPLQRRLRRVVAGRVGAAHARA